MTETQQSAWLAPRDRGRRLRGRERETLPAPSPPAAPPPCGSGSRSARGAEPRARASRGMSAALLRPPWSCVLGERGASRGAPTPNGWAVAVSSLRPPQTRGRRAGTARRGEPAAPVTPSRCLDARSGGRPARPTALGPGPSVAQALAAVLVAAMRARVAPLGVSRLLRPVPAAGTRGSAFAAHSLTHSRSTC